MPKSNKTNSRGGWRGGGRPKKFGKGIVTTTISTRVPVIYAKEAKERIGKMVKDFSERITQKDLC